MITAVDTPILLDILTDDPVNGQLSRHLLAQAYDEGSVVISDVVYSELAPQFDNPQYLDAALEQLDIGFVGADPEVAYLAGRKWLEYREAAGAEARFLPDFLIGAHAQLRAARLLTRDRGFYRSYFPELRLLEP